MSSEHDPVHGPEHHGLGPVQGGRLLVLVVGLVALVAVVAVWRSRAGRGGPEAQAPAAASGTVSLGETAQKQAGIATETVRRLTRADRVEAPGILALDEKRTARLGSMVEGMVVKAYAEIGDRVRSAQVLAEMHSHVVHDAWADYRKAVADRRRRETERTFARQNELRGDPERLGQLLLTAPGGEKVPLASVAGIRTVQGPEAVNHESGQRRLVVQTNVRGRDVGSFVAEARQKLAATTTLPAGYFVEWGGQFENQERATRRLMVVIPASLAIIFLLLFLTFGRVRQALLVILNVPFALVGGIAALWIRGLNLNLSASVGFIALFGVAVLNGIVMIAAVNRLREDARLELRPAILRGAAKRLKPVMMTALVAALGFVPMALSQGTGAEVQRPLASVVIGGITTSTLLTLIVLPTLYEIIEARALRRRDEDE